MSCIVQKYGGSSVANPDKLQEIARLIAEVKGQNTDIAVVVSAMGKTTDGLLAKAKALSSSPSRREFDMLLTCGEREAMSLLSIGWCLPSRSDALTFSIGYPASGPGSA